MQNLLKFLGAILLAVFLFVFVSNVIIILSYQGYVAHSMEDIEQKMDVGVVLGTSRWTVHGEENSYFVGRVNAAADLFANGYVRHLILSGDNAQLEYNEPIQLQHALVDRDVPQEDMTLDYAGFRTLDSVVRSKEVFGQDSIMIISQKFHLPRAIFIARKNGITAFGFVASGAESTVTVKLREYMARALSVADVYIFRRRPKFLGQQEEIIIRRK